MTFILLLTSCKINSRNDTRNFVFSAERRFWAQFREIQSAFPEVRGGCVRRLRIRSVYRAQSLREAGNLPQTLLQVCQVSARACLCVCAIYIKWIMKLFRMTRVGACVCTCYVTYF